MKREQDIEKLLQKAVDEKKVDGLSVRWKNLKKSLREEELQPVYGEVLCKQRNGRRFALLAALPLVCAVVLAIVLPLCLRNTVPVVQYFSDELVIQFCTKTEFYQTFEDLNREVAISPTVEGENYKFFVTERKAIVKGGQFEIIGYDEYEISCSSVISFYDETVTILDRNTVPMEQSVDVNGITVEYALTETTEDVFTYLSWATYKGYTYKIEYSSLSEDIEEFLTELFV